MTPKPGAFLQTTQGSLRVILCEPSNGVGAAGTVLARGHKGIEVAFAQGSMILEILQPENKSRVSGNDYANGRRLVEGDEL